MRTEDEIRKKLSLSNYNQFLHEKYPKPKTKEDELYLNPDTGSCGFHARFTKEALDVQDKGDTRLVTLKNIPSLLDRLDRGDVIEFLHGYPSDKIYSQMPKDNRYGFHVFVLVKGGSKYFMSQGYLNRYKHSLRTYTREELTKMFEEIITNHSDYENTKKWKDIDASLHKTYFQTPLRLFPDNPPIPDRKVHGIQLFFQLTK